jgi:sigma-B regulation protein RsbU (phosphoserine phosphatase)
LDYLRESDYGVQRVRLSSGDLIVAYTDGVVEATNVAGEEWGVEGLHRAIRLCGTREPARAVDAAFAAVDEFSGGEQMDDATILAALVQ